MLELIFEFFGLPYELIWTQENIQLALPVMIVMGCILAFYMFMSFMIFLSKLFRFGKD